MSHVQSGARFQQALGMLGLNPGNSWGVKGRVQVVFSFQGGGRKQGVFVPALLWKVNNKNL